MTDDQVETPGDGRPVRHLVLLRHATAESATGGADADRPLTARGHADAAAAGAWLRSAGYLPTKVICSPTKRARQTWHDVALGMAAPPTLPLPGEPAADAAGTAAPTVRYEPQVYRGRASDLLDLVRATDPATRTVLLIGHNPTISDLSTLLDPVHAEPNGLRTGGIVVHRVDGGWTDVRERAAPIVKWHTARG